MCLVGFNRVDTITLNAGISVCFVELGYDIRSGD